MLSGADDGTFSVWDLRNFKSYALFLPYGSCSWKECHFPHDLASCTGTNPLRISSGIRAPSHRSSGIPQKSQFWQHQAKTTKSPHGTCRSRRMPSLYQKVLTSMTPLPSPRSCFLSTWYTRTLFGTFTSRAHWLFFIFLFPGAARDQRDSLAPTDPGHHCEHSSQRLQHLQEFQCVVVVGGQEKLPEPGHFFRQYFYFFCTHSSLASRFWKSWLMMILAFVSICDPPNQQSSLRGSCQSNFSLCWHLLPALLQLPLPFLLQCSHESNRCMMPAPRPPLRCLLRGAAGAYAYACLLHTLLLFSFVLACTAAPDTSMVLEACDEPVHSLIDDTATIAATSSTGRRKAPLQDGEGELVADPPPPLPPQPPLPSCSRTGWEGFKSGLLCQEGPNGRCVYRVPVGRAVTLGANAFSVAFANSRSPLALTAILTAENATRLFKSDDHRSLIAKAASSLLRLLGSLGRMLGQPEDSGTEEAEGGRWESTIRLIPSEGVIEVEDRTEGWRTEGSPRPDLCRCTHCACILHLTVHAWRCLPLSS